MKKLLLLLSNLVWIGLANSQTPITLGNSNMPGANDTLRYTNVSINSIGNYTQTGVNFNWDFSNVVSTSEGLREFLAATQTPYALFFFGEYGEKIADTLVGGTGTLTITKVYDFYKKQTTPVNAYAIHGTGMTISGLPVPSFYTDKDELYNFPMSYPKYDSSTFKFSTTTAGLLPIKYSKEGYRTTTVDGWGTVKTPYGSRSCLRLITTQYSKDTTTITIPAIPPLPAFPPIKIGIQNDVRSYQWLDLTSKIPFLSVTGNLIGNNFTINQVRYRGYKIETNPNPTGLSPDLDISAMSIYPNPVKDKLWLNSDEAAMFQYAITDINGALVKKETLSGLSSLQSIDVSEFETGLYVICIKQDQRTSYLKFIKE